MTKIPDSKLARTETVDGWTLGFVGSDEPRVRDLDLAEHLGFERPRNIRKLIGRICGERGVCSTVERTVNGRPATEYWLTEAQALKVIAKSETAKADAILDEVIAVYMAWRRGQFTQAPVALDATTINSARVKSNRAMRKELQWLIHAVHSFRGYTKQKIIGWIRVEFSTSSPYYLSTLEFAELKRQLQSLAMGTTSIGSKRDQKLLTASARANKQLKLWSEN